MTETTETTPKESALKRFAKAFYAKVSKAASAAKAAIVRNVGDNETPIVDEGAFRKALRYVTAIPKWVGHSVMYVLRGAFWLLSLAVTAITLGVIVIALAVAMILTGIALVAYKVLQGLSLVLRTPYLIVRGGDCLKTDWTGYALLWTPKYFAYTRIQQVFYAQFRNAEDLWADATVVEDDAETVIAEALEVLEPKLVAHQGGKGRPTNRQRKHRPARLPKMDPLVAGA
jgi:hypothetical protein